MNEENLKIKRHSLAHILALAILRTYPEVKFAIGPDVDNGFYYDIDLGDKKLSEDDLVDLEKKMKHIVKQNLKFERSEKDIDLAINEAREADDIYKLEILEDLKATGETKVSYYQLAEFSDLCRGPHLESSGQVDLNSFKLNKLAGAYWRGDEKNKMLTRVYGLAFDKAEELNSYLELLKEAEKRDHRRLAKDLDLFSISEKVGPGLVLWHPKLSKVREVVESFWRRFHRQRGYDTVYTPHVGRSLLWETSGHLSFFKDSMYAPMKVEGDDYYVKPMNCPFHVEIYNSQPRSWRDLPFRWNELGAVYRYEKSGELNGMLRVRGFTQDDAHIFCRPDQFADEYQEVLQFSLDVFKVFGFTDLKGYIAIRDSKNLSDYMGDPKIWDLAENTIKEVVSNFNMPYEIEEGGAKFYGPSLDIKAKDSIGREWQLTTIQLDFQNPKKFNMTYQGPEKEEEPIMIHRALLGSLERFFGVLIEHYGGAFPVWMAPVQLQIISVGEKHVDYCQKLKQELLDLDLRPEIDIDNETVAKKIRKAVSQKVPYIVVIGDRELESDQLSLRIRGQEEMESISREDLIKRIIQETKDMK